MEKRLDGKVVVITGASSGFGKGCALKFANLGANVVLAARRDYLLDELASECTKAGVKAVAVPTDVSLLADIEALFEATLQNFDQIDIWLNNAGAAAIGNFIEVPLADHEQVIKTDLMGTIYGSHYAMRKFIQQGFGTLINVASMIGKIPAPYYASYSAAKHGVVGLSASLRQEMQEQKRKDIHVCTVMPMAMDTPFFEHAANYTGHEAVAIPPLSDAQRVIDAVVDLAFNPKDEVPVGTASGVFSVSDRMTPGLTEAMMAKTTHNSQIEKAPPAPPSQGSLMEPDSKGTGIHGDDVHT